MLDTLLQRAMDEWRSIQNAPGAFLVVVASASGLIWWGVSWHYSGQVAALQSALTAKDAIIVTKDALVAAKEERIAALEERLHFNPPASRYEQFSNAELKARALALVVDLREQVELGRQAVWDAMEKESAEMRQATTDEERSRIALKYRDGTPLRYEEERATFVTKFRDEAILLHEELLRRLPKTVRSESRAFYEWGGKVEGIADDLAQLAGQLPEKRAPELHEGPASRARW